MRNKLTERRAEGISIPWDLVMGHGCYVCWVFLTALLSHPPCLPPFLWDCLMSHRTVLHKGSSVFLHRDQDRLVILSFSSSILFFLGYPESSKLLHTLTHPPISFYWSTNCQIWTTAKNGPNIHPHTQMWEHISNQKTPQLTPAT